MKTCLRGNQGNVTTWVTLPRGFRIGNRKESSVWWRRIPFLFEEKGCKEKCLRSKFLSPKLVLGR